MIDAEASQADDISEAAWLTNWRSEDFSWDGLAKQKAWTKHDARSLQDLLREIERGASDEELLNRGVLQDCDAEGIYHLLFIPDEWSIPDRDGSTLADRKRAYWDKLFSEGVIRENFHGTLVGIHLPEDVEERFISGFRASFRWIRFKRELRNISKDGNRYFRNCFFRSKILIAGQYNVNQTWPTLEFTDCVFAAELTVADTKNFGEVRLDKCSAGRLSIQKAEISKIRIDESEVNHLLARDSKFLGEFVVFESYLDSIECFNCRFEDMTSFLETSFRGSLDILSCDFSGRVTFADVDWPPQPHGNASASGSRFAAIVTIGGNAPPPVQFFQDAEFVSKVAFRKFSDRVNRRAFLQELHGSNPAGFIDPRTRSESIESGCRSLRKIAESAGDVHAEHFWHRAEIIARRARGESDAAERGFSHLYGLLADYGLSISKPFVALAISVACFAILYAWFGGESWVGPIDLKSIEEGFGFSMNRTLPIGVFADENNVWRRQLLGSGGQLNYIAIRALATAQSIFSAVLIYLGIMAIRRKFRIS